MSYILTLGENAKKVKHELMTASTGKKNDALIKISEELKNNIGLIIEKNKIDLDDAEKNGMSKSMLDRLMLDEKRILSIANACVNLSKLDDPVGEVTGGGVRPNGMKIEKVRVPMGVIGIIYEARPNVTVDAASLCLKSGNTVILRGGKEAFESNKILMTLMRSAVVKAGFSADIMQLVEDTSRETATQMMKLNGYIDVLIPRGGAGLISSVVKNATVPVIETGTGNCHLYVDESADLQMAVDILNNGKTQRPSVCNALESLLVNEKIAKEFLPLAKKKLDESNVEFRGCEKTKEILPDITLATEEDYGTEFLDYIISVKVVADVDEAISHISEYTTGHSECIVTKSLENAEKFQLGIDAAAVYVNCSTRFTDGEEFGLGAEIGISTQKLHARGPMGLRELTTTKYLISGKGQIR
ncbi:MAG: glutamate-5-semialdehyde dehydrogenase [Ruminococcaceae bacterium]|nr:glutamate-5-semialdehyde dehydrogenase [Oscillospiraceae bacterium]